MKLEKLKRKYQAKDVYVGLKTKVKSFGGK